MGEPQPAHQVCIDDESELGQALDAARATGQAVVLEAHGRRYRLTPQAQVQEPADPWANYDPERVKRALAESAGGFRGLEPERLKRDLRAQRGQDSARRPA